MANQNQCNFTGRIGKLEIRYTQDKIPITVLSIAISKARKDNSGQWIDETTWINCKAFKQIAEYINNYAQKGTFVRITATYQENKWTDKSGQQRISPEFLVNDIEILGNRKQKKPQESQGKLNIPTTSQPNSNAIHQADFEDEDIPLLDAGETTMWILILAMYASPYASSNFASVNTQEFNAENMCQFAAKQFEREFETFKDIDAKAICVKK